MFWLKRFCLIVWVLLITINLNAHHASAAAPGAAALLNIIPGVGYMASGKVVEGVAWSAVILGTYVSGLGHFGKNLHFYSIGNIYRRLKPSNRMYYANSETVFKDYIASYNPLNIIDPFNPPLVGLGALAGSPKVSVGSLVVYSFVGLGEEGLFRGFFYPAFTDVFFGSKLFGAITSSLVFSAAHAVGGNSSALVPKTFIFRTLAGLLFCIQTTYHDHDLRKSIFGHTWFDIFVSSKLSVNSRHASNPPLGLKATFEF